MVAKKYLVYEVKYGSVVIVPESESEVSRSRESRSDVGRRSREWEESIGRPGTKTV